MNPTSVHHDRDRIAIAIEIPIAIPPGKQIPILLYSTLTLFFFVPSFFFGAPYFLIPLIPFPAALQLPSVIPRRLPARPDVLLFLPGQPRPLASP